MQAVLGGYLVDDWMVEVLASRIGESLNIPVVHQEACDIEYKGILRKGVVSRNYNLDGYYDVSFRKLLDRFCIDESSFVRMNLVGKMNFLVDVLSKTGISIKECKSYVSDMLLLDLLVLNQDRHFKNFGVFIKNGVFCRAKLYDNGMGMFESDIRFYDMDYYKDAVKFCYSSPYGESIGYTLQSIKTNDLIGKDKLLLLNNIPNFRRSSFPNDMTYYYYKDIIKELKGYV